MAVPIGAIIKEAVKRKAKEKAKQELKDNVDNDSQRKKVNPDNTGAGGEDELEEKGTTAATVGAAATGGAMAGQAMMVTQFLAWMKAFLQMMQQFLAAAAAAVANAIHAIVAVVMQVATAVAAAVGVSVVAATFGVVGLAVLAVVVVVGAVVSVMQANEISKYDGMLEDCKVAVEEVKDGSAIPEPGEQVLKHAQLVYSVYSTYGAPDEHIAGILGNWTCESGIDPTGLEGIYDERYTVEGPKKTAALTDLNDYTLNTLFPMYERSEIRINQSAYKASDGKSYCGLGLGQWTGPRAYKLIQTAVAADMPWYSLECQLIYSISADTSGKSVLDNWFVKDEDNPATAAEYFMRNWEGIVNDSLQNRRDSAEEWYVRLSEWEADVDYANSLIELAGAVKLEASSNAIQDELNECQSERRKYDNSSIAHAAVSYAYTNWDDSKHSQGTTLYQTVHDVVYPGDYYYASCDRGAAVAVRWSGYDISFPAGACQHQYDYCMSSSKWTKVNWNNNTRKLEPGDVLICDNCHTFMYVSNEIIREVWGDEVIDALPNYSTIVAYVEASYGYRSPGLVPMWSNYIDNNPDGTRSDGTVHTHQYACFRCTDPDMSNVFDNAADGVDTHIDVAWSDNYYH